ncbi:unnamed protein product, partial [Prorocentrum cordatum]
RNASGSETGGAAAGGNGFPIVHPRVGPDSQWACKKFMRVVHAAWHWLQMVEEGGVGSEHDLSKACDNIDHGVAVECLRRHAVPQATLFVCLAAWTAPGTCCVGPELSAPMWPTGGLPQGDPAAPSTLVATLTPWCPPSAQSLAYMYDRSFLSAGDQGPDAAISVTQFFDRDAGFRENEPRRQRWDADSPTRIGQSYSHRAPRTDSCTRLSSSSCPATRGMGEAVLGHLDLGSAPWQLPSS